MSKFSIANRLPVAVLNECYEKYGLVCVVKNGECINVYFEGRKTKC
jgi:hypothetical protein